MSRTKQQNINAFTEPNTLGKKDEPCKTNLNSHAGIFLRLLLSTRVLAITESRLQCGADTLEHLEMNL